MRSNGLTASTYTPVADLDPQLAEALLDDLKNSGVAAYTKPVEASSTAGFDRPEFTHGVKDRLYVDAAAASQVRELIGSRDPHLIDDNDDLTWAQLVAGFDQPVDDAVARWPVLEDLQPGDTRVYDERDDLPDTDDRDDNTSVLRWGTKTQPGASGDDDDFLLSTSTARESASDDPGERFVPEPPPPLPKLPPYKQIAWGGLVGGPLLLILSTFVRIPNWGLGFAVAGFIGGFVTLIATMGDDSDDDWNPNGGAVV